MLASLPGVALAASVSSLSNQLSQERSRQGQLAGSVASLGGLISSLSGQIAIVQGRESDVRATIARDRSALGSALLALERERARLAVLRHRLAFARELLSRQLVSSYENGQPNLMTVLLEAHGFADLLDRVTYLRMAETQQSRIISITRIARAQATVEAARSKQLSVRYQQLTTGALAQNRALSAMDAILQSKRAGLARARLLQSESLSASRQRSSRLQGEINQLEAQQRAAELAAQQRAAASYSSGPSSIASSGATSGAAGGWAIPYSIVMCESGGQNLPPNSAGASGYYQIMPATWQGAGGSGPAAYLAPKSEQDAVASRIWNGGAGASNWVCAGIVGYH